MTQNHSHTLDLVFTPAVRAPTMEITVLILISSMDMLFPFVVMPMTRRSTCLKPLILAVHYMTVYAMPYNFFATELTKQIVVIVSQHGTNQIMLSAGSLLENIQPVAKNLSIWFYSELSFEPQTTKHL